jgi:hypothetical protein
MEIASVLAAWAQWEALRVFFLAKLPAYIQKGSTILPKARHSGYLKISGRVIRVLGNSGIEKCYPIFAPKKHYPIIRVRVLPDIPEIDKINHFGRIQASF